MKKDLVFHKYTALGNDYLVVDPVHCPPPHPPSAEWIRRICHRNYGVGSDGLLWGPLFENEKIAVRIFNPDGGEAEKSGNGLRIFSRFLLDQKYLPGPLQPFTIQTKGGQVQVQILDPDGERIRIDMGMANFKNRDIPVLIPGEETLNHPLSVEGETYLISCVSMGNPHCVIPLNSSPGKATPQLVKKLGPWLEHHSLFPHRTNIQLLEVLDRGRIKIEIWERGAGYTLASGSSSCAAAAVAFRLGLIDSQVTVQMPGGELRIGLQGNSDSPQMTMEGPVKRIAQGVLDRNF